MCRDLSTNNTPQNTSNAATAAPGKKKSLPAERRSACQASEEHLHQPSVGAAGFKTPHWPDPQNSTDPMGGKQEDAGVASRLLYRLNGRVGQKRNTAPLRPLQQLSSSPARQTHIMSHQEEKQPPVTSAVTVHIRRLV
jgi:hypothetical protein